MAITPAPKPASTDVSFTDLRSNATHYFDAVEAGQRVRVSRNGKLIAEIVPISAPTPSWKRRVEPVALRDVSLSEELLNDRQESK